MRRGLGIAAAIVLFVGRVAAQPSGTDAATAQALFEDGKRLMQQNKWDEACPKLVETVVVPAPAPIPSPAAAPATSATAATTTSASATARPHATAVVAKPAPKPTASTKPVADPILDRK